MAAITALNVRLGMDASNFSQGADLARAEVNKVAATMRQSTPPAEKFKRDVDLLNKAFSESGRQSKEYTQALEFLRKKYGQVPEAIKPTTRELEFLARAERQAAEDNRFLANVISQSTPPLKKYQQDLSQLNALWPKSKRGTEEYARAVEFLKKKHGQLPAAIKPSMSAIDQLKQSVIGAIPGGGMLANAMKGPAGAMLALAAAAAVSIRGMSQAAQRIDETAKAARSLGMAYRDLVAIQMLAGEVAGLDAGSVTRGIQQFTKRLAEARVDGGKLQETMAAVGLDVSKLAAMAPGEAFREVSDAIAGIPDKAEQIRIAVALVGKEGVKMVELFRQGGGAIDAMAREAERLGAVLSDQQVSEIESMNDAFGRVKMSIQGIWNSLLSQLAPTLTNMAKLASDFFVMVRKTNEAYVAMHPAVSAITFLVNKLLEGFRAIVAVVSDTVSLIASIPGAIFGGGELNTSFSESNRLLDEMDAKANGVASATQQATEAAEALAIEAERAAEAARQQEATFQKRLQDLQIESVALFGNVELAERMRLAAEGYSQAQIDTIMALQAQNAAIKGRIDAEKKAAEDAKKAAEDKAKEDKKRIDDAKKAMEEVEKSFNVEVSAAMKAASDYFEQERQRDAERRKAVAQGPSSVEAGSAEAARFMADQANARIGAAVVPERPTPGEKEIADKTKELLIAQREANAKQEKELQTMTMLLDEFKQNGFRRVR